MLKWYTDETQFLLEEGASPTEVDKVVKTFGMGMGPLEMSDVAGNDISYLIKCVCAGFLCTRTGPYCRVGSGPAPACKLTAGVHVEVQVLFSIRFTILLLLLLLHFLGAKESLALFHPTGISLILKRKNIRAHPCNESNLPYVIVTPMPLAGKREVYSTPRRVTRMSATALWATSSRKWAASGKRQVRATLALPARSCLSTIAGVQPTVALSALSFVLVPSSFVCRLSRYSSIRNVMSRADRPCRSKRFHSKLLFSRFHPKHAALCSRLRPFNSCLADP